MAERIDSIEITGWDEDGFHIRLSTDDGEHDFRITDTETARALVNQIDSPTGELTNLRHWIADHDHEFAAYVVASPAERARVLGVALELDDPNAYDERAELAREHADHSRKASRESGS